MTMNSRLSTNEPKRKEKHKKQKTKQTTRTGTQSEIRTSHGGNSVGRWKGGIGRERYREEEA